MTRKAMLLPVPVPVLGAPTAAALLGPGAALADGRTGTASHKSGNPK